MAGLLMVLAWAAQAGGVLDFSYQLIRNGTPIVRVYDDGARTYLMLSGEADDRALRELAGAAAVKRNGQIHSVPLDRTWPYPSMPGVYEKIVLSVGGRQAIATYTGVRDGRGAEPVSARGESPAVEVGEKPAVRKIPVAEHDGAAGPPPPPPAAAAAVPTPSEAVPTPPPPASPPPLPGRELPDNRVVRVVARSDESGPPAAADPDGEEAGETAEDVAEYKVMIPFAMGRTVLGKEGERAMVEVAQIGPIAREIRIRAPGDSGGDLRRAHGRAAEIHRQLVKAGLVRQRISIEAVDPVPDGRIVRAEVALVVDLAQKSRK